MEHARLHAWIPPSLMEELNAHCSQFSMKKKTVVVEALIEYLNQKTIAELRAELSRLDSERDRIKKQIEHEDLRQDKIVRDADLREYNTRKLLEPIAENFWKQVERMDDPSFDHRNSLVQISEGQSDQIKKKFDVFIKPEEIRAFVIEWGESRDLSI